MGELRRALLLVPFGGGLWTSRFRGVRWVCAFTDEMSMARFLSRHGPVDREWQYAVLLGARLLDEIVPAMGEPAGIAVDVADEDGAMLFPPVLGIVPEDVALDAKVGGLAAGTVQPVVRKVLMQGEVRTDERRRQGPARR